MQCLFPGILEYVRQENQIDGSLLYQAVEDASGTLARHKYNHNLDHDKSSKRITIRMDFIKNEMKSFAYF